MRAETDAEFAEYVRARQQQLLRAAYLVCGDAHLAEDLLQQALVKLALRWDKVRHEHPDAFVRRVLYRDAVSAWRRSRRESVGLADDGYAAVPEPAPEAAVGDRVDVHRALMQLTAKQRAVLVLRFFEDLPVTEVAGLLGCSEGAVKTQTHRGIRKLRRLLGAEAGVEITEEERDGSRI
jgi:RNA polymerase sigma-70 factor (sigma-E family)